MGSGQDPAGVLWRGGVHYLVPQRNPESDRPPSDDEVAMALLELATSGSGRQAEAIVAALLWRPEWGEALMSAVLRCTDPGARRELMYAHVTACYLQQHWQPLLGLYGFSGDLPDIYTTKLGLPPVTSDSFGAKWNLHLLAERRQGETGANFAAEYDRIMHHLESEWVAEGRLSAGTRPAPWACDRR